MDRVELYDHDPVRVFVFDRIVELELDFAEVSRKIGRNQTYIQQFLKRGTPRKLPEGVRPELARVLSTSVTNLGSVQYTVTDQTEEPIFKPVAEYNALSAAGGGIVLDGENCIRVWHFPQDYLESEVQIAPHSPLALISVRGDSMEPTLRSGDRILIDQGDKNVSQPGIFVLWDGDGRVVKRVERVWGTTPARLKLISDNPLHTAYEVEAELVEVIGRAVWVGRQL